MEYRLLVGEDRQDSGVYLDLNGIRQALNQHRSEPDIDIELVNPDPSMDQETQNDHRRWCLKQLGISTDQDDEDRRAAQARRLRAGGYNTDDWHR